MRGARDTRRRERRMTGRSRSSQLKTDVTTLFFQKFSLATPKEGARAYKRVWEGCPSSKLINGDINKVFRSMNLIVKHNGCCVPEIGNRRDGRRRAAAGEPARRRGGSQTKNGHIKMDWIHKDAELFRAEQKEQVNQMDDENEGERQVS